MMLLGGGKDVCEKVRNHVETYYKNWSNVLIIFPY
jgi:hypothetical protein